MYFQWDFFRTYPRKSNAVEMMCKQDLSRCSWYEIHKHRTKQNYQADKQNILNSLYEKLKCSHSIYISQSTLKYLLG